jgi:hypothetical protein
MRPEDLVKALAESPEALLRAQGPGAEMMMPFRMNCPFCGNTVTGTYIAKNDEDGNASIDYNDAKMDTATGLHAEGCPMTVY